MTTAHADEEFFPLRKTASLYFPGMIKFFFLRAIFLVGSSAVVPEFPNDECRSDIGQGIFQTREL